MTDRGRWYVSNTTIPNGRGMVAEMLAVANDAPTAANARLIAAVPSLLEAAESLLAYLDEVGPCHLDAGMPESGCDMATAPLRAALAKARGTS